MDKKLWHKSSLTALVLALVLTVIVGVFGQAKVAQAAQTTITYGIWDSRQEPGLRKLADEFEAANPDIKVDIQVAGWGEYWTMLEAAATGGSLPDVFWMHSNEIYKYGANDQLLALDDLIKEAGIDMSKFPKGLVDIYNVEGKQYGIPKDFDTIALWYNKKLFDEAGVKYPDANWTWDDLKEAAKKLTNKEKEQYGIATFLTNQEGYYNFVFSNGGQIIKDGKKSGYADPKTIEGLEYFFSFAHEGFSPVLSKDGDAKAYLENGKAAMALFGSWQLNGFLDNDYLRENFDVAPLPKKDGKSVSVYNGLANVISANTPNKEAAWKFVQFLSSPETQKKASELGIAISAYEGSADTWVKVAPKMNLKVYIDAIETAQIRPYTHETTKWEEKAYEILKAAYTGERPVKEAAEEAAKVMDEIIAEEQ